MSTQNIDPLPADPSRQAQEMLSACQYQILQTVSAWLDLRGTETLFVEGAEDFDVVSGSEGNAIQVKVSPRPISLGQKEIQDALNNYWKLRSAAQGRSIKFTFLTRAAYTYEKERLFGEIGCLEIWQRSALSDEEVLKIKTFLINRTHIGKPLRTWLERATLGEVRKDLIEKVTWQSQADTSHQLERTIYNKLSAFGEKRTPAPASIIKQVALRLEKEVWHTLRKSTDRRLDIFRLDELWEETTHISLPRSAIDALAFSGLRTIKEQGIFSEILKVGAPPLPGAVTQRPKLIKGIQERLSVSSFVNIHGSSKMGKTTIAKLIVSSQERDWRWWSAGRIKIDELQSSLAKLIKEVILDPQIINLVIDDLEFSPTAINNLEESLAELAFIIKGRRGQILITSQKAMPIRLQHLIGMKPDQILVIPNLNEAEVIELADTLGCSDEKKRKDWAVLVRASTHGHPLLTAVRLIALQRKGWPILTTETFYAGSEAIDAEKADARQLIGGLPEIHQELLQRLSVFPAAFQKSHAVELGVFPPPITNIGIIFDMLVGPWIEPLHSGYFVLTPLLSDGAKNALSSRELNILKNKAAMVLVKVSPRTTIEAAHAFSLFWDTENEAGFTGFFLSCSQMTEAIFTSFSERLSWFTYVRNKAGQILFPKNTTSSLFLRHIQFRVAVVTAIANAQKIMHAWRWEIENTNTPQKTMNAGMMAAMVLPYHQVEISPKLMVILLRNVANAMIAHPEIPWLNNWPKERPRELGNLPDFNDTVSLLSFVCSSRSRTIDFLEDFLAEMEICELELRNRILTGFVGDGIQSQLAVDRTWLTEADKVEPDWNRCLSVYEKALTLSKTWGFPSFGIAAMRGISVVLDEYIKDHRRAHLKLDEIQSQGGLDVYAIHDRRACVYFSEKSYALAENEWRLALKDWPLPQVSFDTNSAFAARSAGVSAARQQKWSTASEFFLDIIQRLPKRDDKALIAGAYGDAGYCLWKAGKPAEAISSLIDAWELADQLPLGQASLRAFTVRKTIGHIIAWLSGIAMRDGGYQLDEPIAGVCSSSEISEKIRELPETENSHIWILLMRLEREFHLGKRAFDLGGKSLASTTDHVIASMAGLEYIAQALASGSVQILPAIIMKTAEAFRDAALLLSDESAVNIKGIDPQVFNIKDGLIGAGILIAALVRAASNGHDWQELIKDWRTSLPPSPDKSWLDWFETIEKILGGGQSEAIMLLRAPETSWENELLAAWHVLCSKNASPEDIFYAHAIWLGRVKTILWLKDVGSSFCKQVEDAWGNAILKPALLRQPMLSIPAILKICSEGNPCLAKAARILLIAAPAIGTRLGKQRESIIRELAENNSI